ncbi:MAG: hypothetical protein WCG83_02230 [Candidatus Peregrinibacteria bacterium]
MTQSTMKASRISTIMLALFLVVVLLIGGVLAWKNRLKNDGNINGQQRVANVTLKRISSYLHKDAILYEAIPPPAEYHAISVENALTYAIRLLEKKGMKGISICESEWIAAPLGGFLINGKGNFRIGNREYSTFRIGVRDGSEGNAGEEFMFIARSKDDQGNVFWYPEPGPDFRPAVGETYPANLMVYEYLGDRKQFETLSNRFK